MKRLWLIVLVLVYWLSGLGYHEASVTVPPAATPCAVREYVRGVWIVHNAQWTMDNGQ